MEVKSALESVFSRMKLIESFQYEIQQLREMCAFARSVNASDDLIQKFSDSEREVLFELEKTVEFVRQMIQCLKVIEDDRYRVLLQLHYFDNLTWREVANQMNYNVTTVSRLNIPALKAFENAMSMTR
jgi:DNA-directed RNA polymerase specialized sigma subunit